MPRRTLDPAAAAPPLRLRGSHPLWPAFPGRSAEARGGFRGPKPHGAARHGLGSSGSARRYSRNRRFFLLLRLLRCFSSPGSLPMRYVFTPGCAGCSPRGFPHSDTRGSSGICPSPRLFAACRVFHRPPVPRHPPRALPAWPLSRPGRASRFRLPYPCILSAKLSLASMHSYLVSVCLLCVVFPCEVFKVQSFS